jgi:hypothetical protein
VANGLERTAAEGADAFSRGKDLLFEKVGTHLDAPEHAKPRKEFHARGGVAPPDKVRERSSNAAMHAKFVKSREMQPAVVHSAAREGAMIRGRGELDPLDKSTKLVELACGSGGEARIEHQIEPLTEHAGHGGIRRHAVGEKLRHGGGNWTEREPGVTPERGAYPVADANSGDAAVKGE